MFCGSIEDDRPINRPEQPIVNQNDRPINRPESVHQRKYTSYRYTHNENLRNSLISISRALQDYINAFDAIPLCVNKGHQHRTC